MRHWCLALLWMLACASAPEPPAPGTSTAWGHLRLVPREGVAPGGHGAGSYGDRRLRGVEFVDYSRPGFAVIYVVDEEPPGGELELAIRSSRIKTFIEPEHGAIGAAGRLVVRNESPAAHVLSYPAGGVIRRLEPGARAELPVSRTGEQGVFLLDVPDAEVTVFAAPGAFTLVAASGRFALNGLTPGHRELRVWHPRFPPAMHPVHLEPGGSVQVDFEIGVGRGGQAHAH
jgi:hypothetical protein